MTSGAIQALDVSSCGLSDSDLRTMIVTPLTSRAPFLEALSIAGNPGRLPAHVLSELLPYLTEMRELNLAGSLRGDSTGAPLLPPDDVATLDALQDLDLSGYHVDEATLSSLERFLHHRHNAPLTNGRPPARLRRLALNHCGITGYQAARLFQAIGPNPTSIILCLSNNPLDYGLSDLTSLIHADPTVGPAGLYLDMLDFRDERSYLSLLHALTSSQKLVLLSLAGTAPPSVRGGTASGELVSALHGLFADNTSLRYLDLSGFRGRLDDGQLPAGFGKALAGLANNSSLTHLRLRNQNLTSDDAGTLGRALAQNCALRALDVRGCAATGGGFLSLSTVRFLVDSLRQNSTLVSLPLPYNEREAVWRGIVRSMQRGSTLFSGASAAAMMAAMAGEGNHGDLEGVAAGLSHAQSEQESLLRALLDAQFARLDQRLRENRDIMAMMGQDLAAPGDAEFRGPRHRPTGSVGSADLAFPSSSFSTGAGGSGVMEEGDDEEGFAFPTDLAAIVGVPQVQVLQPQQEEQQQPALVAPPVLEVDVKETTVRVEIDEDKSFEEMMNEFKAVGFGS